MYFCGVSGHTQSHLQCVVSGGFSDSGAPGKRRFALLLTLCLAGNVGSGKEVLKTFVWMSCP